MGEVAVFVGLLLVIISLKLQIRRLEKRVDHLYGIVR